MARTSAFGLPYDPTFARSGYDAVVGAYARAQQKPKVPVVAPRTPGNYSPGIPPGALGGALFDPSTNWDPTLPPYVDGSGNEVPGTGDPGQSRTGTGNESFDAGAAAAAERRAAQAALNSASIDDLGNQRDLSLRNLRNQNLESRKRILLGFGSKQLASGILPAGDPTLDAISDNPYAPVASSSYLANRRRKFDTDLLDSENQASVANTFFGGGRTFAAQELNRGRAQDEFGELQNVRAALEPLDRAELTAQEDWVARIAEAKRQYAIALMGMA